MIKEFRLKDYGPIAEAQGQALGNINLILGENSTGKTFLLKALYSAIRSMKRLVKVTTIEIFQKF